MTVILTPPDFFGMTTSGLEYGEVECWISPAGMHWLRVASTSFAKFGCMRWGREVTGALPSGTENLEGHHRARPKVRLRGEEHIGKFAGHITQLLDGRGGSIQGHVSQTQSPAGVAAVGPRRAITKNAGPFQSFQQRRRGRRHGRGCVTWVKKTCDS